MPNKMESPNLTNSIMDSASDSNNSFEEMASDGVNLHWILTNSGEIKFNNSIAVEYLKEQFNIEVKKGMILHEYLPKEIGDLIKRFLKNPEIIGEMQTSVTVKGRILHFSIVQIKKSKSKNEFALNLFCNSGLAEKVGALKQKLRRNKFITDHLFDVVWTKDLNFKSSYISKSILKQRGFTSEEFLKLEIGQAMTPESTEFINNLVSTMSLNDYSSDNPLIYFIDYYKKDGSIMHGENTVYPIFENDKIKSIYGITKDVTERIINNRKIKEQRSELQTVLNNTDEMIASIDLDYKIVTMNEANKERIRLRFGKTPKIGDLILDYVHPDNVEVLKKLFKQIIAGKRLSFQHIFTTNYDNNPEYFETSLKPIILDNNEIWGISVFVKDITDTIIIQRTLEESENRLHRITDSTLEGIWEYNIDTKALYLSQRLKKITGYRGKNELEEFKAYIKTVIEKDNYEKYKLQLLNQVSDAKSFSFEIVINTLENVGLWLQIKAFISSNLKGEPVLVSGLILDITDRKIQETALRKAKESAEEMNRLKSSFIANMSHEVRTPLNGILGVSQLLEEMDLTEEVLHYIKLQKKSGFRLLDTINNIMSLSRLEAKPNQQELISFDLNNYILKQLEPFEIMARQKNIALEFNPSEDVIMVPLNEHLFYQVFNNLVGNAIKFTPKGKIKIYTNIDGSFAKFTIVDTGIGIKKENQGKIFDSFVQESTGTGRKFEGSGLGLAIVKKYVEWSGGKITVESKKGIGSIFTLNLPLSKKINR